MNWELIGISIWILFVPVISYLARRLRDEEQKSFRLESELMQAHLDLKYAKLQVKMHYESRLMQDVVALFSHHPEVIPAQQKSSALYLERLEIRSAGQIHFLDVDDVDWIEAADNYVILHAAKEAHIMRETMARLESKLDPERFIRVHRSTIIRIDRLRELKSTRFGDLIAILQDGTELRVARSMKAKLQRLSQ